MAPEEFLVSQCLNGEFMYLCLKSCMICLNFIPYFHVWIRICIGNTVRIHKAPEYGSTTLLPTPR